MDRNFNHNFHIIVIDDSEQLDTNLSKKLQEYQYKVIQFSLLSKAMEFVNDKHNKVDLIILNLQIDSETSIQLLQHFQQISTAQVIILSKEDIGDIREEYFKKGALDYYSSTQKLDHIASDINDTITKLSTNKRESIVIIDHSYEFSGKLKELLEIRSYRVFVANDIHEGLDILKKEDITLLILDIELSDSNGIYLLEGLKDLYLLDDFLVMAVSHSGNPSDIRDALKLGAADCMKKPLLYEEFLLKTDILVSSSRSRKVITKQKQQIEYNLQMFKELVNSSINVMLIFKKNICVDCNNEAVELLEYSNKKELIGKSLKEIFSSVSTEHYEKLIDDATDHYFEDKLISKSGIKHDLQIKERNILISGKFLKIIAAMDISDIKRNNKIISQQSKMASMGEMIGNIAHQWRQPLTAISVAASGIKLNYEFDMEDKKETLEELENIVSNTKFLSSTIEDFQNYLKNDRTKSQFFIKDTIRKTLAIIHANIESYEIDITQNYIQNKQIEGIENDLVQVLLNIINNAIDILKGLEKTKPRKIFIETDVDDNFVTLSVNDSGGGIPTDIIEKVFEPYFTTKHQSRGTGLGLYMTHQIIEKIGGNIAVSNNEFEIDSEKYFGAKFLLKIPFVFES